MSFKRYTQIIYVMLMLLMCGVGEVWSQITAEDIIIQVMPSEKEGKGSVTDATYGSVSASVGALSGSGDNQYYPVTLTVTPADGYQTKTALITAEKMIAPSRLSAPRRTPGTGTLTVTGPDDGWKVGDGSTDYNYTFDVPDDYDGAYVIVTFVKTPGDGDPTPISTLSELQGISSSGSYILTQDIDASSLSTSLSDFSGIFDGNFHKIYNLSVPLFSSTSGAAVIKNIIFEGVNISVSSGDAGTIAASAADNTRIYNCGILPTSTERDDEGNVTGFSGSSVGGSGNVGGLVGTLNGSARVINCYSYATITGGNNVGGIVGYNDYASTADEIRTMVMNCMFYGDITGGTNKSPVYGGKNINNLEGGLNTFNYYAYEQLPTSHITSGKYNCALAVEDKYLNRFEFYRLLLNSNKKLAAFYAMGSVDNANKMAKWVLETADRTITNPKPYPILKPQGYYPSIINPDIANAPDSATIGRNHGGKLGKTLSVTIATSKSDGGQTWPTGASITKSSLTLQRTDKDFDRFNFNYDKVQLPYYNDVGEGNYTGNRVVTGWKITAITAIDGDPYTSANYPTTGIKDFPDHNYADRKSSNKDLYSVSKRVFSQGAYFDVPYGVTSITIEPYWGKAVYLADKNYDVVYKNDYTDKQDVTQTGTQVEKTQDGTSTLTLFDGQKVETSIERALNYIANTTDGLGGLGSTVYDNALVLIGNYHLATVPQNGTNHFTMMSVDTDNDHEPDYSLIYHHIGRSSITPIRFDFLNIPGTAQAQKPNGASLICNFTIFKTRGWFEITNTALVYSSQVEYENLSDNTKTDAPLILLGGVFDQFVSTQSSAVNGKTIYIHVGSNVWINEFGLGTHSDGSQSTPHVPVSVTGGEYEGFYLTGTYNANATVRSDNAECYISGGHIVEAAGASLEQINGNVHWQIYNADIDNFFGGGINDAKPIKGNITTDIYNSYVTLFCGGPKFGNMQTGKNVKTKAEGCTFGKYFGAGYGGTSLARKKYYDTSTTNWTTWAGKYVSDRGNYFDGNTTDAPGDAKYGKKGVGVATDFDYEFFVWSSGTTGGRFFVKFASFSLAQCNNVESTLKKCTVETNFYGGGNLGKVVGTATSELEDCTVIGDVYGAGYSASLPTVEVRDGGFTTPPNYNSESGMFEPGVFPGTTTFTWQNATEAGKTLNDGESGSDLTNHILYTNTELTGLGEVAQTNLTIKGTTTVGGSVYGGGEESNVSGNTEVNITGGTITENVFGGGKGEADEFTCSKAMVGVEEDGNKCADPGSDDNKNKGTIVIISNGQVNGNVYGGGEVGRVEWNTQVTIGAASGTSTPVINGSVFGAGAGKETHGYSALVRGNSSVTIQGNAKVLQNVYGGGEKATVGRYWVKGIPTTLCEGETQPSIPDGLPDEMPYKTRRGGKTTVIVQGSAQVGPDDGGTDIAGHVFGAGKGVTPNYVYNIGEKTTWSKRMVDYNSTKHTGEPGTTWDYYEEYTEAQIADITFKKYVWEYFTTEDKYFEFLQTLALVTGTDVTISGGTVKGSVFGGSENGFVQDDTDVKIQGGTIGTEGQGGPDFGNVYGGGKGDAEHMGTAKKYVAAGLVKGNTNVTIEDGTIWHNVYGGGAYGSVGEFTYDTSGMPTALATANTGTCTVTITGGTLGSNGDENGMVFGSSRGDVGAPVGDPAVDPNDRLAWVYSTHITIGDTNVETSPAIKGSVYGSGENGHTFQNTIVNINKGTIGIVSGSDITDDKGTPDTSDDITYSGAAYPFRGNVYGGGCGTDMYDSNGDYVLDSYNPLAGIVRGTATVNISGGHVVHNVYGAGAMGSVGGGAEANSGKTTVNISGGRIGHTGERDGNVFGAARGEYGISTAESGLANVRESAVNISYTTTPAADNEGKTEQLIAGSVFGGGESGMVKESVAVNMTGGLLLKDIYGGGALAHTQTSNWDASANSGAGGWADTYKSALYTTTVRLTGGTILGEAYGGGLGQKTGVNGATSDIAAYVYGDVLLDLNGTTPIDGTSHKPSTTGTATTNASGCVVDQIFGCNNINGTPKGDVMVHVYATQNKLKTTIADKFRLENESLEKLDITENTKETDGAYMTRLKAILTDRIALAEALSITVSDEYKTLCTAESPVVADLKTAIIGITTSINTKTTEQINAVRYDMVAVYGGGDMATYVPVTPNTADTSQPNTSPNGSRTQVIIEGCSLTSIETVYGGGNAAAVPETNVDIKGAYEIGYLFGGGNGKDKILINNVLTDNPGADIGQYKNGTETVTYGTGNANSLMEGGLIHEAYGGSNTKGVLKGSINQISDPKSPGDADYCCDLILEKIVGAGKYADIDGDVNMTLSCQPSSKVPLLFAGADEANVNGNITLNITNGHFGKVFGGNNLGGAVKGKITVNVEETGCQPIKIDELYLGGNEAAYSIYGYYESEDIQTETGKKILKPRESATDSRLPVKHDGTEYTSISEFTNYAQPELNIISCTYIGEVFGGGYGEGAVMYANPTVNVNLVKGDYGDNATIGVPAMMNSLGLSADAYANPNNVGIIRNVYGGGNAANIVGNTTVNIATKYLVKEVTADATLPEGCYTRSGEGTTASPFVYTPASGTAQANVTYYEKSYAYIIGSVFGGGNAADVLGNTNVTMSDGYVFNGIFGGGYAGNVGTFTERSYTEKTYAGNIEFDHSTHNDCIGKPTKCKAGTGKCTVLVNGGQIGPYTVATLGMNRPKAQGGPVPEGWVWGGGQGLIEDPAKEPDTHFKSYVGSTDVTIGGTAFVLESIIGGGEFGRVLGDTKVTITGNCQIGVGAEKVDANNKPIRYNDADFINPSTATPEQINAKAALMAECSHFPYGKDTNDDGIKDEFLPYDPYYDEFKETTYITTDHPDLSPASSASPTDGKTWIGCVFAGGSGYMPYLKKDNNGNPVGYDWCSSAGLVEGNTNLTISGGHILTNVYGGNEVTNVKGTCKVTMTDGTIGVPRTVQQIIDHPLTCYLFGAGKGDPRPHFNTETNVQNVEIDISGGTIYGSVFGGGEDGHVQRNVKMTIGKDDHTGPIIGTWGTSYVDGNIFGGGRGFSGDAYTAGNVAGSVDLDIKGGTILGSIYGGGRLGSVGYGLYPSTAEETYYGAMRPDNTGDDVDNTAIANFKRGYVDVEISGGTIGNRYEYIIPSAANTPTGLTFANIASWTDANWKTWKTHNNIPLTEFDTESYRLKHTKGGNVFAGGMGRLYQLDGITPISAVNWWKVGCVKQTKLTVKGGTIKSNVYGGGELGAVKPYLSGNTVEGGKTEVIVQNANATQIGTEIKDGSNVTQYTFGSVYGGGYGSTIEKLNETDDTTTENDNPKFVAGLVHGDTKIDMQGGKVLASVYGGGEVASVNGKADVAVSGGEVGKDKVGDKQFGGATMGNVYGGGSGHPNIVRCGRILKNTKVTISGANTKIYHNVYGGGAYGTVGEFTYTTGTDGKVNGVTGLKTAGTGTAEVIITGGTIGTDGHENGMIFGSSRGDVNEPGARDDHTAWVYDAKVTIGTSNSETGPLVKGSVYGSGENGHTFNDAIVNIYSGTVGITDTDIDGGARYTFRGNVYGGGCGTDIYPKDNKRRYNPLAGIVYGTTTVNMTGGHVVHDVFGGGAMGSVGKFTYNTSGKPTGIVQGAATNSGKCTLNISGGMIGMTDMQMTATGGPDDYGHVFGAGRGEVKDTTLYDNLDVTGYVNSTEVNISGTAFVTGSVYGGAESGHVLGNTLVQVSGGQIGCGVGKTAAYTADEWAAASPSTLAPCASWTYTANGNGAPYDPNAGAYDSKGGATTATDGHTFYGNVFGGGSGYYQYSPGIWIRSAGRVEGNTSVVISGGHILSNVYGGNECTDVFGSATISMTDGTVGVPRTQTQIESNPVLGHIYGGGKGDKRVLFNTWTNVASSSVSLTGGKVYGSVYGGGEDGHVIGNAVTTINGADLVIGCDGTSGYDGNVFGGGQGSSTALTAGVVGGNVTLNIQNGAMKGSVYGGGRLAAVGTFFENPEGEHYGYLHPDHPTDHGNISVNLTGGTIYQDVFGGGMGVTNVDNADRFAISRNVTVHLNENVETTAKGCIVKGRIFGANNANASPKGDVLVHIHATQNEGTADIATKVESVYDVDYVFGGGNNADYVPTETGAKQSTEVIIEGCDLTSIEEVYGGGFGAATPGTKVEIRGTKIINNVFGGGYGAGDDNPGANVGYRTGGTDPYGKTGSDIKTAVVRLMAGRVNNVYGGSNTKGDIRGGSSITNIDKTGTSGTNQPCCDNLTVGEIYGGGKNAEMTGGAEIVLGCMPNDWISEIYAGAENADVGNDVSLTLTSGKFGRVFGGNKSGGQLDGQIEVNIEENPECDTPIIIGELYGGGNLAPYSIYGYNEDGTVRTAPAEGVSAHNSPRVNVYSFTSIGNIYGGGLGEDAVMVGDPTVNIDEVNVDVTLMSATGKLLRAYEGEMKSLPMGEGTVDVKLYPHTLGKMGVIGNVFGGGNAAKVIGNTNVNIGTESSVKFESQKDDTITGDDKRVTKTVDGADIRGNVFGGGNNAVVTGDTNVNIGKKVE